MLRVLGWLLAAGLMVEAWVLLGGPGGTVTPDQADPVIVYEDGTGFPPPKGGR